MTVQLYEGCWGVTRDREKPFKLRKFDFPPTETEIRYIIEDGDGSGWREDGTAVIWHIGDIIAVFATEPEADAYIAEGHKPLGQIVREEYAKLVAKDAARCADAGSKPAEPAAKPVTWPDGVTEMRFGAKSSIEIDGDLISLNDGTLSFSPEVARQLAALLLAAADKVEGRG